MKRTAEAEADGEHSAHASDSDHGEQDHEHEHEHADDGGDGGRAEDDGGKDATASANVGEQGAAEAGPGSEKARARSRKKPTVERKSFATKFDHLTSVVEELQDDVLQVYAGNKAAMDRLRKGSEFLWSKLFILQGLHKLVFLRATFLKKH